MSENLGGNCRCVKVALMQYKGLLEITQCHMTMWNLNDLWIR